MLVILTEVVMVVVSYDVDGGLCWWQVMLGVVMNVVSAMVLQLSQVVD